MKKRIAVLLAFPALLIGGSLSAQVAWETPFLMPPGGGQGLGIYLLDAHGGDLGALFTWRRASAPIGVGFRGGLAEEGGTGDLSFLGGVDFAGSLVPSTEDVPFDVMWALGAGIGIGTDMLLSFPAGISVGTSLETDEGGVRLAPYATPRVVLDVFTGPGDDLDLSFGVDLGLNLAFNPRWELRFAASVGDREAVAAGIAIPRD